MEKTRVCILQNGFRHGGTDTFVINLCTGIDREKFDITIVNPENEEAKNVLQYKIENLGIKVIHTAGFNSLSKKIKHLFQLYRILRKGQFNVFHSNIDLFNGPQLLVAKLAGIPNRICHSHNTAQGKFLESPTFILKFYQKLMKWLCWNCSTSQIGCSKEALEFLFTKKPWIKQEINPIIHNGIDLNKYYSKIDIKAKKKELGLFKSRNILTVGRIFDQKNPEFIINVFNKYCAKDDNCDLVWVGIGEKLPIIMQMANQFGIQDRVHFLGSRDDVADIMKCCDLFLLPSKFEGLGIVLIEAQASGLNCLASDVVPKLANCGGVGFLSLNDPINIWCNRIEDELKYRHHIDRQKLEEFSIERMVNQVEQFYLINEK